MNGNWKIKCWGLCLFFVFIINAKSYGQFRFDNAIHLSKEEGLPNNHIEVIKQCPNGFMWIGTRGGLCRFDGSQFKIYLRQKGKSNSLLYNRITAILTEEERIWAVTGVGLSVLEVSADTFSNYIFDISGKRYDSVPKNHLQMTAIYKDQRGDIWCGTKGNGFSRYNVEQDSFEFYKYEGTDHHQILPDGDALNNIISIHENLQNDSIIWFGTTVGLLEFNRYSKTVAWYYFPQDNKMYEVDVNTFRGIYQHDDGLLYVGSWGSGAKVFDPKSKTIKKLLVKGKPSAFNAFNSFNRKNESEIWMTAVGGLQCYNTKTQEITFSIKNKNKTNNFYGAQCIDKDGRIWTYSYNGVYFYDPVLQQFADHSFTNLNGDLWGFARDIVQRDSSDIITVCAQNAFNLFHYNRQLRTWATTPIPEKYHNKDKSGISGRQMLKSPFGDFTINQVTGLFSYDPKNDQIKDFPFNPTLQYKSIRTIMWDSNDQLWIGTWRDGLLRWNPKTNQVRNFQSGLDASGNEYAATSIPILFEDSENNVWIKRNHGISIYIQAQDTIINLLSPINKSNTYSNTSGFAEDRNGRIWVTGRHGFVGYAEVQHPEKGLIEKINLTKADSTLVSVSGVTAGPKGDTWFLGNESLIKLNADDLKPTIYSYNYGIPDNEFYAFEFLPSGELAIGLRGSFVLIDPENLSRNKELVVPYVSNIQVHDENFKSDTAAIMLKNLDLEYWENSFSFDFSARSFTLPEYNKFRYRLKNFKDDWIDAKGRRFTNYTNVPDGNYIFQLQAANNEGIWNDELYELSVSITTSWWNTWWFRIAVLLLISYFAYSLYRYRILQIRNEAKLKSEFEKQLANVEMNALRAQMNPHFLFNCLNSIDSYIIKSETKKASEYLNKFARLIRLILQNSRSNYVNLKDEIEALDLYMNMESLRFRNKFDYEIKIADELDIESIDVPPMLIQPYIENAIWHGLMHKREGSKGVVQLKINQQNGSLQCIVEDNGIGREKAMEIRARKITRRKKSMGMRITQDRIQMINKMFDSKTSVEIIDLKDKTGQAVGTRVELFIPI